ncbi:hypothetical protein PPL_12216 [Heterostelium album PN500]|uniref:Uncharacterized protein n=1 Tax=Heterostelium pallidum (strain ATCC 26659 / Pp 5 / PN500) TaxID=670386 RepID=D3BM09_HETP5|nr:hypothetical protein PPL_12216 [Heterostelium album PN500]EFA77610.1 hypothetical protein PPL_12216 [Heterostelium album PN500]|eukprot:XP_020429738.1 hypothetical protein PPL_12216 [Heterostelium album PN500]
MYKTIVLILALYFIIANCEVEFVRCNVRCRELNPLDCTNKGLIFEKANPTLGTCCDRCVKKPNLTIRPAKCASVLCPDCVGDIPPGECCPKCGTGPSSLHYESISEMEKDLSLVCSLHRNNTKIKNK